MLEDRTAQAVDGEADHVVEVGHQFVEEPLLQPAAESGWLPSCYRPWPGGRGRSSGGVGVASIDEPLLAQVIPIGITRGCRGRRGIRAAGRRSRRPPGRYAWIRSSGRFSAYCCVGGHTMPVSTLKSAGRTAGFRKNHGHEKSHPEGWDLLAGAAPGRCVADARLQTRLARASRLNGLMSPIRPSRTFTAHPDPRSARPTATRSNSPLSRRSTRPSMLAGCATRRFCRRIAGTRCRPGRRYPR